MNSGLIKVEEILDAAKRCRGRYGVMMHVKSPLSPEAMAIEWFKVTRGRCGCSSCNASLGAAFDAVNAEAEAKRKADEQEALRMEKQQQELARKWQAEAARDKIQAAAFKAYYPQEAAAVWEEHRRTA